MRVVLVELQRRAVATDLVRNRNEQALLTHSVFPPQERYKRRSAEAGICTIVDREHRLTATVARQRSKKLSKNTRSPLSATMLTSAPVSVDQELQASATMVRVIVGAGINSFANSIFASANVLWKHWKLCRSTGNQRLSAHA